MLNSLKAAYRRLPAWLRAALATSSQLLVASILLAVLGVLADWQADEPISWTGFLGAAKTATIIAVTGVVTAVYRWVKPPAAAYPDAEA